MPANKKPNYAFIDSQNLNLAIREMGWKLDFARFRVYLKDKFLVEKAYIFIGYMPSNRKLYSYLQDAGFHCIFRPTLTYKDGKTKGNCDAELILQAMIDYQNYSQAVIVTGDGDFYCLVNHLLASNKLKALIVPNRHKYSALLKLKEIKPYTRDMNDLREKLAYSGNNSRKKKNPHKDVTLQGKSSIGDNPILAQAYQNVKCSNKKDQYRRSVETLGLSGHGDSSNVTRHKPKVKHKGKQK
ncbi:MAG: NYN domain-containing protein [Candidatus Saccharimonadales bacterium]